MFKRPLYSWLPNWAKTALKSKKCKNCGCIYQQKDLLAIGIREVEKYSYSLFAEHECSKCQNRTNTIFRKRDDTLEDVCYGILDHIRAYKIAQKTKEKKSTHNSGTISDSEVKAMINFMQKSKNHDDFMRFIGGHPFGAGCE